MENKFSIEFENLNIPENLNIKPEYIIAQALFNSGLISDKTTLNGDLANNYIQESSEAKPEDIESTEMPLFSKLGSILLQKKIINKNQLKEALNYQKSTSLRIGEILVKLGFIQNDELIETIEEQQKIREILTKINKIDICIDYREPNFELQINKENEKPFTYFQEFESKDISKAVMEALSTYFFNIKHRSTKWSSEIVGMRLSVDISND